MNRAGVVDVALSELNPELAAVYAPDVLAQMGRLLGQMDREVQSVSYGSFDRDHWSWKFRDFPLGMLQSAVYPLALVWYVPFPNNPYYRSPRLLEWITGAISRALDRQHTNGTFDAVSPNEHDAGPTLGVLHGLLEAFRLVRHAVSNEYSVRFHESVRKACNFVLTRSETHAFISNHWAWFAVAFLSAHELLGEKKYLERAEELLEQVFRNQSPEGWYLEYEGADPGYESFGIFHLAVCWRRTGSARLLESLRKSVEFYAHCVHPDGSVGGVYGSRHTGLYFPGGFEILSGEIPMAAAIAGFMRKRLNKQNVVTPETTDAQNLAPIMYTWLEACFGPRQIAPAPPPLPCEILAGVRCFSGAGIVVAGSPHYYAILNAKKGGVCRVFDRQRESLTYEDAGYLVCTANRKYASQIIGLGQLESARGNEVHLQTMLAEVLQAVLTPGKFLLLRLLNLTIWRSLTMGSWLRRTIVNRLILTKRPGPLRLQRSIIFEEDRIVFRDRLELTRPATIVKVEVARAFTSIHMGSAKYFLASDLQITPLPITDEMTTQLNRLRRADSEFRVCFENISRYTQVATQL